MYTFQELEKELCITRNALSKRARRLNLEPLKIDGRLYFDDNSASQLLNYKPASVGKCLVFYRIVIYENSKNKWYVRHAGLSLNKANKLLKQYKEQGILAIKKQCNVRKNV